MPCAKINVPGYVRECSIPNITGELSIRQGDVSGYLRNLSFVGGGCFTREDVIGDVPNMAHNFLSKGNNSPARLQAELSNTIYGKSMIVQPPAFQTLIIIKIWTAAAWTVELFPYVILFLEASKLRLRMAPTEALPLTISNPYVPYKAPDKASAFALRYVLLVVPVMFGLSISEHHRGIFCLYCLRPGPRGL